MLRPGVRIKVGDKHSLKYFYYQAVGGLYYIQRSGHIHDVDVYYIGNKPAGAALWYIHVEDAIPIEGNNEDMLHLLYREEDI